MKRLLFFLSLLANYAALLLAQHNEDILINHLQQGDQNTDGANSLVINNQGIFVLWSDYSSSFQTYISHSADGGASFEVGKPIGGNSQYLFGGIATNADGTLFTVWNDLVGENLSGIHFAKSTDQGMSFSTPIQISSDGLIPQIQVDGSMVYLSFFQPKANQKIGLFFCRSVDNGETFGAPFEITEAPLDMNQIKFDTPHSLFVDAQGTVFCTWNDGRRESGGTDIYLARSTDQGVSFGSNIRVNPTNGETGKTRTGSMLGAYGSQVFVVWREEEDNSGSDRKILFAHSTDQGNTFAAEQVLATGGFGSPCLTLTPSNRILITYPQIAMNEEGLFYTLLNEDLEESSTPKFLNSFNEDARYQSVFVTEADTMFAVWTGDRHGNQDVFFTRCYIGKPPVIKDFELIIGDQEEVVIPADNPWGLMHMPDGAVSYAKMENEVNMWIATGLGTSGMGKQQP